MRFLYLQCYSYNMETNVLLSKIVANPQETTWAQAYSTLNLFIVLSLRSQNSETSIVTEGKELFEKIQKEYFSLDEKGLSSIKKSVENAISDLEPEKEVSIVLSTVTQNFLYIVIASGGAVILKRNGKVGTIAAGEEGKTVAFSGELKPDDIVILETGDFSKKIPIKKLTQVIDNLEVSEISENLAPIIHEESQGTEAAIILQYKNIKKIEEEGAVKEDIASNQEEGEEQKQVMSIGAKIRLPKISFPINFEGATKKKALILAIVFLGILLLGSIVFERSRQEQAKRAQILSEIIEPNQKGYDEAVALISLNKGLALEEFEEIKRTLEGKRSILQEGTKERKNLDEFIGKVESKIGELNQGATLSNRKLIFNEEVDLVGFRQDSLFVVKAQGGEISLISTDGKVQKSAKSDNKNIESLASDSNSIYLLGDSGITKTDKKSGKTTAIVKDAQELVSLDTFGSNLYGLNAKTKTVDKYAGGSSGRSDYFKADVTLNNPVSMAIDSSIWILDSGKVRKFTKGTEETFSISGLTKPISENSKIFTGLDYENVYTLDKDTNRIISISKSGEVKNQYVSKELSNASSFSVDESRKKIYVVISGKLYSFDL